MFPSKNCILERISLSKLKVERKYRGSIEERGEGLIK